MKVLLVLGFFALVVNGREIGQRIIGGEAARAGQFPFAAAINITTKDSKKFCNGALVGNKWVLTTAYCADGGIQYEVLLGSTHLTGDDNNRLLLSTNTAIVHPDYDSSTLVNDIALIELRMPIEFNGYVQKIGIAYIPLLNDSTLTTLGWGQLSDSDPSFSNQLNFVNLAVIPNIECQLVYGDQITDNMTCVEGNFNEGVCMGDSGAPLIENLGRLQWLVGVASFFSGNGCESTDPSGYTRTFPYLAWINSYISEADA